MTQPKVMPKLSAGDPASVILPQSKPTTGRSKSLSRLPSKLQPADQRSRRRLGGAEESSGASVCIVARVTREQRERVLSRCRRCAMGSRSGQRLYCRS